MPGDKEIQNLEIAFAEASDIPCWMELGAFVVDGFPPPLRGRLHSNT